MVRSAIPTATRQRLDSTAARLNDLTPTGWTVTVTSRSGEGGSVLIADGLCEGSIDVIVCKRLEPRDVPSLPASDGPVVVSAPWISPRTRQLLAVRGIGYLDDTGNAAITMSRPGLVIRSRGTDRDPDPKPSAAPTLRGPRAWALLRTIAEVSPPYGVQELARTVGVDPGYVSRVLTALIDELLIERRPRGPVTSVDWEGIVRKLASTYSLFDSNDTTTWVATGGPQQLIDDLSSRRIGRWAVTASFATTTITPVAAPEIAVIYTDDAERVAEAGHLLPATSGSNVVLAVPYDQIVFTRTRTVERVPFVSVAQAAVDALTGPGRMPAEGEALLDWMRQNTTRWQANSLTTKDG